ncbi:hypothetical protein EDD16DRAFT_163763 [Pisolithus croceorrhizus]|nr:hypothetical protein EDD16DRAFT_163763 [Pisolithus croceorrhizus]
MKFAVFLPFASALCLASAERILGMPAFFGAMTDLRSKPTSVVARQCTDVCCTIVSTVFGPPAWFCNPGTSCSSDQIATCCTQTSSGWDCP